MVARNAWEILQLHEHFVDDLREAMSPLGYAPFFLGTCSRGGELDHANLPVPPAECVDDAIRLVSTKFAVEVSVHVAASVPVVGLVQVLNRH